MTKIWARDLIRLGKTGHLHVGFREIKEVKIIYSSLPVENFFKKVGTPKFGENVDGNYLLEIFIDSIEGGGVMIQYDLIDLQSGNTVWELGRTFNSVKF